MTLATRLRTLALAVAVLCAVATTRAADVNVVGTWKGTMDSQMGQVQVDIVVEGAAPLAGQVSLASFGGKIEKGTLESGKIAFDVTIEHGTLKFEGTVAADEMNLVVTGTQGAKMPLVAKRQK